MKKNLPLSLIFLVVFIDLLGFGILIPILPTFATKELGMTEGLIGIVIAVYSFVQFIFNPLLGTMSDKYGRRMVILVTLFLNVAGYLVFSFSHTFLMLMISRVICGIGGSSIGVAQAYIADVTTREDRAKGMGLIGVAFGLGFVFGPLAGGVLANWGYEYAGYAAAMTSMLALVVSYFALPEPEKKNITQGEAGRRKIIDVPAMMQVFSKPAIGIVILLFFILTFSVANIYGTFALLGTKQYHFSDMENGFIFGIVGIIGALVQGGLIGKLSKKYTDTRLIMVSSLLMIFGLGFIPYGINMTGVIIVVTILSFGTGILQPTILSLISKITPQKDQGMVLGVNQSVGSFARMLGPLWGGFSFQYLGYQVPFLTGAICTLFIFIYSLTKLKKQLEAAPVHVD
ncbi:MAG: tetracycline resistance MFS efflux pump [Ignavibacteriales bacterium]